MALLEQQLHMHTRNGTLHIGRADGFHPADALSAVNNQITNLKHHLILLFYKKGVLFEQLDLRSSNNTL